MGIRKRVTEAKDRVAEAAKADATPENNAAMHIAEGILHLEKWRNIDALNSFMKALEILKYK